VAAERDTLTLRRERVLLVAVLPPDEAGSPEPLSELAALVDTAGGIPVGAVIQARQAPDPATYVGKGKAEEIRQLAVAERADALVADHELSAAQIRNLEKACGVRVFDRSELILDIFALGARTREAKLQVALAQMEYRLPRLKRYWTHLDRIGGGIGARGGLGETQLEVDRRMSRRRMGDLKKEIAQVQARRQAEVATRKACFSVALVGYTNAGKSLLMRRLTGYAARSEDRLFSTLDTRTRRARVPGGFCLVSDTVGFIRNLPHHLVASFRATLEEVRAADLLLHVIDAAMPEVEARIAAVEAVLVEVGGIEAPVWRVWNKMDRLDGVARALLPEEGPGTHWVSARSGEGVGTLLTAIGEEAGRARRRVPVVCQVGDGEALARLAAGGSVLSRQYDDGKVTVSVDLGAEAEKRLRRWAAKRPGRMGFPETG
jgi:GTP-binding protein HflX